MRALSLDQNASTTSSLRVGRGQEAYWEECNEQIKALVSSMDRALEDQGNRGLGDSH